MAVSFVGGRPEYHGIPGGIPGMHPTVRQLEQPRNQRWIGALLQALVLVVLVAIGLFVVPIVIARLKVQQPVAAQQYSDSPTLPGQPFSPLTSDPAPQGGEFDNMRSGWPTPSQASTSEQQQSLAPLSTAAPTTDVGASISLFCFTLIQPVGKGGDTHLLRSAAAYSDEPQLLSAQLEKRVGLFACDKWVVYSNETIPIGNTYTVPIAGSLACKFSRHYALNTEVFVRVWEAMAQDGQYRNYDWIVKVDADTVFFPRRLRNLLGKDTSKYAGAVYLNNCWKGMHGPIEVVSREAAEAFSTKMNQCNQLRSQAMQPYLSNTDWNHAFGEDVFIARCLGLLRVRKADSFDLLEEASCPPKSSPQVMEEPACDSMHVAFHPFKTVASYFNCLNRASAPEKFGV